jgi:NAD(P)-dependent dehydrogenase (short-subunit alcohol dehydrogenase family)
MKNEIDVMFYSTREAWPHLVQSRGVIINIGSIAGMLGNQEVGALAHAAAKGAVIAMTRQLAVEGGPYGVRAVCISPGTVISPATEEMENWAEIKARLLHNTLIGRLGVPEDIVSAALFLASDEAGYITGANIMVDGGTTAF